MADLGDGSTPRGGVPPNTPRQSRFVEHNVDDGPAASLIPHHLNDPSMTSEKPSKSMATNEILSASARQDTDAASTADTLQVNDTGARSARVSTSSEQTLVCHPIQDIQQTRDVVVVAQSTVAGPVILNTFFDEQVVETRLPAENRASNPFLGVSGAIVGDISTVYRAEVVMTGTVSANYMDIITTEYEVTRGDPATGGDPNEITVLPRTPTTPAGRGRGHSRSHSMPQDFRIHQKMVGNCIPVATRSSSHAANISFARQQVVVPDHRGRARERDSSLTGPTSVNSAKTRRIAALANRHSTGVDRTATVSPSARMRSRTFVHSSQFYKADGHYYHRDSHQHESSSSKKHTDETGKDDAPTSNCGSGYVNSGYEAVDDDNSGSPRQSDFMFHVSNIEITDSEESNSSSGATPVVGTFAQRQSSAFDSAKLDGAADLAEFSDSLRVSKRRKTVTFGVETRYDGVRRIITQITSETVAASTQQRSVTDSGKVQKRSRSVFGRSKSVSVKKRYPVEAVSGPSPKKKFTARVGGKFDKIITVLREKTARTFSRKFSSTRNVTPTTETAQDELPPTVTEDKQAPVMSAEDAAVEEMLLRHLDIADLYKALPPLPAEDDQGELSDASTFMKVEGQTTVNRLLSFYDTEADKIMFTRSFVNFHEEYPDEFEDFMLHADKLKHRYQMRLPQLLADALGDRLFQVYEGRRFLAENDALRKKQAEAKKTLTSQLAQKMEEDSALQEHLKMPTDEDIAKRSTEWDNKSIKSFQESDPERPRSVYEVSRSRNQLALPSSRSLYGGEFTLDVDKELDRVLENIQTPLPSNHGNDSAHVLPPPVKVRYTLIGTPARAVEGENPVWRDRAVTGPLENSYEVYQVGGRRSSGFVKNERAVSQAEEAKQIQDEVMRRNVSANLASLVQSQSKVNENEPLVVKSKTKGPAASEISVKKTRVHSGVDAKVRDDGHMRELMSPEPLPSGQSQYFNNDHRGEKGLVRNLTGAWEEFSSPVQGSFDNSSLLSPSTQPRSLRQASVKAKRASVLPARSVSDTAKAFDRTSSLDKLTLTLESKKAAAKVEKFSKQDLSKVLLAAYYKSVELGQQESDSFGVIKNSPKEKSGVLNRAISTTKRIVSSRSASFFKKTAGMTMLPMQTNEEVGILLNAPIDHPAFDSIDSLEDIIRFGTAYLEERAKSKAKGEKDAGFEKVEETKVIQIVDLAEKEKSGKNDDDDLNEEEKMQRELDAALLLGTHIDGSARTKISVQAPVTIATVDMDDILSRGATQAQLKADVPTSPKNMPRPYSWYQLPSESTMSFANGRSARFDTPRQPRQRESRFTTARTQYGQPGCPFWHGEVDENDPEYNKAVVESIIYRGGEGDQGFRTMIVPVPRGMDIKEVLNEKFTGKGMILSASLHGTSKMTGGFNNLRVIFVNAPNFSPEEVLDFSILPDEPAYMLSRTAPMNSYLFNEIALGYTRMVHIMGLPDEGKDEVLNTLYSSHAKQMYIADPLLYSEWDDEGTFIMEFATIKAASTFARANAQFATAAGLVIQCVWSPCTAEWEKAGVPQSHVASPKSNVAEQLEITLDYGDDDSKEEPALPSKGKAKFADDSLEDGEIREEAGPSEIQTPAKKLHTVNKPRSARYWNTKYDGRLRLYSRGSNTFPRTGDDDDFVILTASAGQDVKGKGKAKMVEILSPLAEFQLSTRPRPRPAPVAVEHNDLMNYNAPSPPRAGPVSGLPRSEAMIDLASPPTVLDQANYSAQRSDRGVAPLVVAKGSEIAGTRLFTPVLGTAGPPSPVRADSPPRLKFQGMMSHLAQSSGSGQKQKESQSAGPKLMGGLFRRKAPVSYADLEADKEEAVASKKSEVKAKTETKAKTEVKEVKKTGMRQQLKNFMHSSAESFKTGRSSSAADKIVYSGPRPVIPGIAFTPGVPTLGPSLEPSTVPAMGHYVSPTGRNWDDEDEEEVEVASPSAAKVERLKEKGKAKEVEKDEKKEE